MFPFADIKREYTFQNEKWVFDRLNDSTYNKFWKEVEGEFVQVEPPTFVLSVYGGGKIVTKLTVILHRYTGGVQVLAIASTNIQFYIISTLVVILMIVQLFTNLDITLILGEILILFGLVIWDRWAKRRALKKLERLILHRHGILHH